MEVVTQTLAELLAGLRALDVDWQDERAIRVIARLRRLGGVEFGLSDVAAILEEGPFEDGLLILRLFLGLSKDQFGAALADALAEVAPKDLFAGAHAPARLEGAGQKRYLADRDSYLEALGRLGILEALAATVGRPAHWSDVLVERLRSGRGSAIAGQVRGRGVENFAEAIVACVFGADYDSRVTFVGRQGRTAKCDFAIPSRDTPRVVVEAKGYGATGSKMTDVLGDVEKIIAAKRSDTVFLFVTDGLTWKSRQSDLKKLLEHQNQGDIARIYTFAMADRFEADLAQIKAECGL